ncbi:MAG: PfkB family carbohydrate kinase [Candidatus Omnitrophica bacterium]|nr:PfkB family carbohydrate kinase [Candidatus Omnitrophota bacterium]
MEKIYKKIKKLDELKAIVAGLKKQNKRVAHCHGVFDLIHPGHIRHLAAAKKEADVLIVTVTSDSFVRKGPGRPIFNENLRAETLASFSSVDYVAINHAPTATNCIKLFKPDVYVKGQDYKDKTKDITGNISEEEDAVVSVGGRIAFTHDITFSSSKLINEHMQVFPEKTRSYLRCLAAKYPIDYIFEALHKLKKLKILVIGEAIIDQYYQCEGMDKSRKSNVVVYKYISEESFAGGSLAIANHIAGLSKNVTLVTLTGEDNESFNSFLSKKMNPNIKIVNFVRPGSQTIVKRRFINSNQKLFEICYLNDGPIDRDLEKKAIAKLKDITHGYDLVIVSDFGHGFLTDNLVRTICKEAKFLAVNTQTNGANMGFNFITRYSNVDYAALDKLEIRYAAHDRTGELGHVMKKVASKIGCKNMIITTGAYGALSLTEKKEILSAPALATDVIDPVGAGDAFLAFTAPLVAIGVPQDLVLFIGNAVGALAVQIICNRNPVDPVDLKKFITTILK